VLLDETFPGVTLDLDVWLPYYLPHWSSRAESEATYEVRDGELRLSIPPGQPRWCPDLHDEPMRVSCIQSGSYSGPIGSTIGQQPFAEGLTVREEQPTHWGYTPHHGHVEIRMRGVVDERSMFAFWMSGIEDLPERSGEICIAEIFGAGVSQGAAEIGIGVHRFRDPTLREDFSAGSHHIDVREYHRYAVDWRPDGLTFAVDDEIVKQSTQSPDYPMQLMIGVFDFPARAGDASENVVPELFVSHVLGT